MRPEVVPYLKRGVFHALVGLAFAAALLFAPRLPVLVGLAMATAVFLSLEIARLRFPFLGKCFVRLFGTLLRLEEGRRLTGSSYFLIGCLITAVAFPREIAALAILFLSLGDPAATVIGVWKGRIRHGSRSVEGDLACLVVCLLVAGIAAAVPGGPPFSIGVAGAVAATFFQTVQLRVNDNLTIPLGSAAAMAVVGLVAR